MQPSMGTFNSLSSRVVKDSTPSWHQILRCIKSLPNLFLTMMNLYLVKFEARCFLNERAFFFFESKSWHTKTHQLGKSSTNFIFAAVNLNPIVIEKTWTDGESWRKDLVEKVNRGEYLRWVGPRYPLTRALTNHSLCLISVYFKHRLRIRPNVSNFRLYSSFSYWCIAAIQGE